MIQDKPSESSYDIFDRDPPFLKVRYQRGFEHLKVKDVVTLYDLNSSSFVDAMIWTITRKSVVLLLDDSDDDLTQKDLRIVRKNSEAKQIIRSTNSMEYVTNLVHKSALNSQIDQKDQNSQISEPDSHSYFQIYQDPNHRSRVLRDILRHQHTSSTSMTVVISFDPWTMFDLEDSSILIFKPKNASAFQVLTLPSKVSTWIHDIREKDHASNINIIWIYDLFFFKTWNSIFEIGFSGSIPQNKIDFTYEIILEHERLFSQDSKVNQFFLFREDVSVSLQKEFYLSFLDLKEGFQ